MKRNKTEEALDYIRDSHLAEAAGYQKRRIAPWMGAVAAVLAVCLCLGMLWRPTAPGAAPGAPLVTPSDTPTSPSCGGVYMGDLHSKHILYAPVYPKMAAYPLFDTVGDYDQWRADQKALHDQPEGYADSLDGYFAASTAQFLSGKAGQNITCSPLNIYMALATLAEITDGQSRQQILDLLNADSLESLRTQAGQVWKAHYNDDGLSTSILAASLWLSQDYAYNEETAQLLADHYFASIFRGDLGSEEMNDALRAWLSEQTEGLLDQYIGDVSMDPRTALALATTISYRVQWRGFQFREERNTQEVFHGVSKDTTETFMHTTLSYGPYYWSDRFGAVSLPLEDGSRMWLFLPDEGITPEQLMQDGDLFAFLAQDPQSYRFANRKDLIVNLSLPKFDVSAETDLISHLQTLGVTDVFQMGSADFTPIFPEPDGGCVNQVKHAARVAIDEEGVTAAAFTLILRAGAGMPPEEEMDFVLDRPFAFIVESEDGLPLFAGIVNEP